MTGPAFRLIQVLVRPDAGLVGVQLDLAPDALLTVAELATAFGTPVEATARRGWKSRIFPPTHHGRTACRLIARTVLADPDRVVPVVLLRDLDPAL